MKFRIAVSWVFVSSIWMGGIASANPLNPDLSVIGTFGGAWTDASFAPRRFDGGLSELELALKSDVDPYFTAEGYLSFSDAGVDVEEAWVSTLALPAGFRATAGKIRATFGKLNLSHAHVQFTITPPPAASMLFDESVLADHGVRVAWLAPLPVFVELTAEALRGSDPVSFSGGSQPDWTGVGHLKTFVDLSDAWSLELGGSGAGGPNAPGSRTTLLGADLALRWRNPETHTRRNVTLFAEAVDSIREDPAATIRARGGWALVDVQLAQRWHVAGRADLMEDPLAPSVDHHAYAGVLSYSPSEFSNVMLEGRSDRAGGTSWTTISGRLTWALGPHGAHPF